MSTKVADGMVVHFGLDGRPARAETNHEWLANMMQRDGSFMVPQSLAKTQEKRAEFTAFVDEMMKLKEAGLLGEAFEGAKKALTTPIPGTGDLPGSGVFRAAKRIADNTHVTKAPASEYEKFLLKHRAAGR